jgi:hypothetical protein
VLRAADAVRPSARSGPPARLGQDLGAPAAEHIGIGVDLRDDSRET